MPSIVAIQPVHASQPESRRRRTTSPHRVSSNGWLQSSSVRPLRDRAGRAGQRCADLAASSRLARRPCSTRQRRTHSSTRSADACRPPRTRADQADGVYVHRRRARHVCRGCLHPEPPAMSAAARKRAASGTRCRPTTTSGNICSVVSVSTTDYAAIRLSRCSVPAAAGWASSLAPCSRRPDDPTCAVATKLGNHSFRVTGITAYLT